MAQGKRVAGISHYGMTRDLCKHLLAGVGPEDVEDSKEILESTHISDEWLPPANELSKFPLYILVSFLLVISIHQCYTKVKVDGITSQKDHHNHHNVIIYQYIGSCSSKWQAPIEAFSPWLGKFDARGSWLAAEESDLRWIRVRV